jgi:hypothetical protein
LAILLFLRQPLYFGICFGLGFGGSLFFRRRQPGLFPLLSLGFEPYFFARLGFGGSLFLLLRQPDLFPLVRLRFEACLGWLEFARGRRSRAYK